MRGWLDQLRVDPIPTLMASAEPALVWCVRRDLLGEADDPEMLWQLPGVTKTLRRQRPDGSWHYSGARVEIRSQRDYDLLATYEALLPLVYQHGLDARHPAI